jgi:hypothetical protein
LTENHTPEYILRIRIIAPPDPEQFAEFDLARFHVGEIYEVPVRLATLLIISGYAESAGGISLPAEAADFGWPRFPRVKPKR